MTLNDLIHPSDASALNALKNIPALPKVMEKVFEYGYDEIQWTENVTTNLRLCKTQMPEIYNRLPPICQRLGIPVPELYLQMTLIPNAWTSGHKKVYIVLTLGLIRRCKDEELDAILAHECGHILCQHVLYQTLANAIFSLGDTLSESIVGSIGNMAMKPIRQALIAWSRASELSADRVACLIAPADVLARALARISLIPKPIVNGMDLKAWANQGKDYEEMKNGTAWNKIVHWMANSDVDHPYCPVRVYEAFEWEKTEACLSLRRNPFCLDLTEKSVETKPQPTPTTKENSIADSVSGYVDVAGKKLESLKSTSLGSLMSKFK